MLFIRFKAIESVKFITRRIRMAANDTSPKGALDESLKSLGVSVDEIKRRSQGSPFTTGAVEEAAEKPEDKPKDPKDGKPTKEPEAKPGEKPAEKPVDEPKGKEGEKPEDKPEEEPVAGADGKPKESPEKPEDKQEAAAIEEKTDEEKEVDEAFKMVRKAVGSAARKKRKKSKIAYRRTKGKKKREMKKYRKKGRAKRLAKKRARKMKQLKGKVPKGKRMVMAHKDPESDIGKRLQEKFKPQGTENLAEDLMEKGIFLTAVMADHFDKMGYDAEAGDAENVSDAIAQTVEDFEGKEIPMEEIVHACEAISICVDVWEQRIPSPF